MEIIITVIIYVSSFFPTGGIDGGEKTIIVKETYEITNGQYRVVARDIIIQDDLTQSGDIMPN